MASLIRTIARRLAREGSLDEALAHVAPRTPSLKRKRTKGGRPSDDYRSAKRFDAIKASKQDRKTARAAAVASCAAPPRPKPWSRVTPPNYPQRAQRRVA